MPVPNRNLQPLSAAVTYSMVSAIMEDVKKTTGHYPTRADVLRYLPPPGFVLTNLEEAYDQVKRRGVPMKYADIAIAAKQAKSVKELCAVNERAEELFNQGNLSMTDENWRDFTKLLSEIHSKLSA